MTIRSRSWTGAMLAAILVALAGCDSAEERAQKHFESGMELLAQGEVEKAQLEFRNVLRLQENNIEARYQFARILHDKRNLRGAVGQYLGVVELDPTRADARVALAEIHLIAGRHESVLEAQKHIDVALESIPDDLHAQALKATVEYKLGNVDDAVERARKVLEQAPGNATARLVLVARSLDSKDFVAAEEQIEIGLSHEPENLSLNVVKLGLLEQLGKQEESGAQLERMVGYFPDNLKFRETYAKWLNDTGDKAGAEAQLREIADRKPDDFKAQLQVVRYVGATRGPDAARGELERLISGPNSKIEYELALASLDYTEGEKDAARTRLEEIIAREGDAPDGDKARIELARLHLREDREAEANALVDQVLVNDPKNEAGLTLRGSRLIDEDKPEEAIRDLRAALDASPRNTLVLLKLAQAHERNGSRELAQERLSQAVQVSGYDPRVTRRYSQSLLNDRKLEVAENVLMESLARHPNNRDLLVALSGVRLEKRNYPAALQIADLLERIDPEDEVAARIRAAAYMGQKRYEDSINVLASAASREGDEGTATMISLVRTYLSAGDPEKAEEYLGEQIAAKPDDAAARILLGSVLAAQGKAREAEQAYRNAIRVDPESGDAYTGLVRLYRNEGRFDEADATIQAGLDAGVKNDEMLRLTLAMRLEEEGRFDDAIAQYEILYDRNPESVVVANNLASLLADHRASDPDALERAFGIARRFRDSRQPYLRDTYGWLLHLRGESERAIESLKFAAEQLGSNALVQYHAGVVYAELGQKDQARAHLQRAIELAEIRPFAKLDEAEAKLAALGDPAAKPAAGTDGNGATETQ